jgi:hypothetical protein
MTAISAKDASLLALLAERPRRKSEFAEKAFYKLGPDAQHIAEALSGTRHGVPKAAVETAKELHRWVKSNRKSRKRR